MHYQLLITPKINTMKKQLEIKTERELKLFVAKNRTSITRINGVEFGNVYPILEVSNNYASYYDVESQGNKFLHAPFSIEFKINNNN